MTFGNPETTTGGNALKFYASVRLDIRRCGQVKQGDLAMGSRTRVKVVKNKLAPALPKPNSRSCLAPASTRPGTARSRSNPWPRREVRRLVCP